METVFLHNSNIPLNTWGRMTFFLDLLKEKGMLPHEASIYSSQYADGNEHYTILGVNVGTDETHIMNIILKMSEGWRENGYIPEFEECAE